MQINDKAIVFFTTPHELTNPQSKNLLAEKVGFTILAILAIITLGIIIPLIVCWLIKLLITNESRPLPNSDSASNPPQHPLLAASNSLVHIIPPSERIAPQTMTQKEVKKISNNGYIFPSFQDTGTSIFETLENTNCPGTQFGTLTFDANSLELISYSGNVAYVHFNNSNSHRDTFTQICSNLMGCLSQTTLASKITTGSTVSFDIEYRTRRTITDFFHRDGGDGPGQGDDFLLFMYKQPTNAPILPTIVIDSATEGRCLSDQAFKQEFINLQSTTGNGTLTHESIVRCGGRVILPKLSERDVFGFDNKCTLHATPSPGNVEDSTLRNQWFVDRGQFNPSIKSAPFIRFGVNIHNP